MSQKTGFQLFTILTQEHDERADQYVAPKTIEKVKNADIRQTFISTHFRYNYGVAGAPFIYLESMSLRSGLGLEEGVMSSLEGKAVRSSSGLGVLVQFCQGFWLAGPEEGGSLSGVERWLLWKGSVWVSSSRGTPTIRSCLRRGRRPCVD